MADISIHAPGYVKDNSAEGLCSVFNDDRGMHVVSVIGERQCTINGWLSPAKQYELALRFAAADQMQKALEGMLAHSAGDDDGTTTAMAIPNEVLNLAVAALALAKGETLDAPVLPRVQHQELDEGSASYWPPIG